MENTPKFNVMVLGVVFDPEKKKILLGKIKNNLNIKKIKWCFPGGRVEIKEEVNQTLKREIKLKTGYDVKNLGCIFSEVHPEDQKIFDVYFLCEKLKGEEKAADDLVELKWVKPKEVEKYLGMPIHKVMKEYLDNLS